jgi:hypothetical protein
VNALQGYQGSRNFPTKFRGGWSSLPLLVRVGTPQTLPHSTLDNECNEQYLVYLRNIIWFPFRGVNLDWLFRLFSSKVDSIGSYFKRYPKKDIDSVDYDSIDGNHASTAML